MNIGDQDPRRWTPARYVHAHQRCWFCGAHIPRATPGRTTGTRGTKAFFNTAFRLWECCDCRAEATRADLARLEPRVPAVEACEGCGYRRLDSDSAIDLPLFALRPCAGCELSPARGMHRICPRCAHVEHRSYGLAPTSKEAA
jgi:hypothetical protein